MHSCLCLCCMSTSMFPASSFFKILLKTCIIILSCHPFIFFFLPFLPIIFISHLIVCLLSHATPIPTLTSLFKTTHSEHDGYVSCVWGAFHFCCVVTDGQAGAVVPELSRGHVNVFLCSGGVVLCYVGSGESWVVCELIISVRALQVHGETLKQTLC